VTGFAGVGSVGFFVGVGGVEGCGIWGSVTGVTAKKSESPKIREKKELSQN
jgi:hypothetical protein